MATLTRYDDPRASAISLRRPRPKKAAQPQPPSPPSEMPTMSDDSTKVPVAQ
jgi:hypothetical protein